MPEKQDSLTEELKDHNCLKYQKLIECSNLVDTFKCKLCGETWQKSCDLLLAPRIKKLRW